MNEDADAGPWDLGLEVTGVLREPGCGWNYSPGFNTHWDGRHYPEGMCPFAWNAFSPLVWALRYGSRDAALPAQDQDELTVVCPDPRHMILWRIFRMKKEPEEAVESGGAAQEPSVHKLRIEVSELPNGPGCERGYQLGDSWDYDGEPPEGLCPLAWKVLSLWLWALRYRGSPRPMEWTGDEVEYGCPMAEHPVVFRIQPVKALRPVRCGA
jgi:uncharacterized repeat protein (TIGR04076 family)